MWRQYAQDTFYNLPKEKQDLILNLAIAEFAATPMMWLQFQISFAKQNFKGVFTSISKTKWIFTGIW